MFPDRYSQNGFGAIRTVREFDDVITAPCFGYRDAEEYYEAAGAKKVVADVRVPMLMITAEDDPFVPYVLVSCGGRGEKSVRFDLLRRSMAGTAHSFRNQSGWSGFGLSREIVEFCEEQSVRAKPTNAADQPKGFSRETAKCWVSSCAGPSGYDDHVVFAAHAEFAGNVDSRLIRKRHARLEQRFCCRAPGKDARGRRGRCRDPGDG